MIFHQIKPSSPLVSRRKRDTAAIELILSAVAIVLMLLKSIQEEIQPSPSFDKRKTGQILQSLLNFLKDPMHSNNLRHKMKRAALLQDESQTVEQRAIKQIVTCIDVIASKNYSFHPVCQEIVTCFHTALGGISTFDDISLDRVVYR